MAVNAETIAEHIRQFAEQLKQVPGQEAVADTLLDKSGPAAELDETAAFLRKRGIERIQKPSPELEIAVSKQSELLIRKYKLHQDVYPDLSDKEARKVYRRDFILPDGAAMPEEYRGSLDQRILVVDPRIELSTLHQKMGVMEYINTSAITNLTEVPRVPYVIFTHDSQRYRPYSVEQALTMFAEYEVGKPLVEISNHYLQFPKDFDKNGMVGMDAAGSRYEDGRVPCLDLLNGEPRVDAYWIGPPDQDWGAGSRGKEVIELGV